MRILHEEECNMAIIPMDRHEGENCMKAKQIELEKLKEFDTYKTVKPPPPSTKHPSPLEWVV